MRMLSEKCRLTINISQAHSVNPFFQICLACQNKNKPPEAIDIATTQFSQRQSIVTYPPRRLPLLLQQSKPSWAVGEESFLETENWL